MKCELPIKREFELAKHVVILGLAGSKSYGTETLKSDTDWKGVLIPPRRYYMSPFSNFEQTQWKSEVKSGRLSEQDGIEEADEEGTIFSLDKFIKLSAACNPNVIELLFLNEEHYDIVTHEGRFLIEHRDLFLSERALYTFTGYAMSQLKRIRTHKSWLDKPILEKPTRAGYGLPEQRAMPRDQLQAARKLVDRNLMELAPWLLEVGNEYKEAFFEGLYNIVAVLAAEHKLDLPEADSWLDIEEQVRDAIADRIGYDANFMEYLRKEKSYSQARTRYKQYQSWVKHRNPARAEIEARYGYDCKHAMHLVRLLRMGGEILETGAMQVYRPDREELLEIRNGSWTYERLVEWGDAEVDRLNALVADGKSVVPKKPPVNDLERISIEVKEMFLSRCGD